MNKDNFISILNDKKQPTGLGGASPEFKIKQAVLAKLAEGCGLSLGQAEILCLENRVVPEKYLRNFNQFSISDQVSFLKSEIAVVGLGGLGGHVLEILVRAGIGKIRGADGDIFEDSNLNRQFLCETGNLGVKKAIAAEKKSHSLNPAVSFSGCAEFLDKEGMLDFTAGCHVVVDALGGLEHRMNLVRACAKHKIPLVTAAMAGQAGYVATVQPGGMSPVQIMGAGYGQGAENLVGTPAPAVVMAASVQAGEVLKLACGKPSALSGKILLYDLETMNFDTVRI